jgi:hypothetical protein
MSKLSSYSKLDFLLLRISTQIPVVVPSRHYRSVRKIIPWGLSCLADLHFNVHPHRRSSVAQHHDPVPRRREMRDPTAYRAYLHILRGVPHGESGELHSFPGTGIFTADAHERLLCDWAGMGVCQAVCNIPTELGRNYMNHGRLGPKEAYPFWDKSPSVRVSN